MAEPEHQVARGRVDTAPAAPSYQFGALMLGDGTARFRLWAPSVQAVTLELNGQPPLPMKRVDDGFHEVVCECVVGSRYRYRISADLCVPDPASRLQDGDVHSYSVLTDASAYAWRNVEWRGRPWTETVLYEVHCGLLGGFRGVQERLADWCELGITAIELMPIADFPGPRNWGYDGVLPYAPDNAYGSPEDLRLLIDTAHCMGMQVILDVVYNHFGPDGNYLPSYAPEFFRDDIKTAWGPAIDFRKPQVRAFFAENALYWLNEYRFDGLRLDAVHAISERDWLVEMAAYVRGHLSPDRHVHLILENDDNAASLLREGFDAQWNDDAHHIVHHILTGEAHGYYGAYTEDPARDLAKCLAEGFIYQGQPSPARGGEPRGEPSKGLPPYAFIFFLQNHDQTGNRALGERLTALCDQKPEALRAAVTLQLLAPHIPLLFMGEEYGSLAPFQYFTSFSDPDLARAVSKGRRNEFAAFPAFSDPEARSAIPDPNDLQTWQNSIPLADEHDLRHKRSRLFYQALLQARRQFITPHLEGAQSVGATVLGPNCAAACWRLGNGSLLRIYCNLSGQAVDLPEEVSKSEIILFSSGAHADETLRTARLAPYSTIATVEAKVPGRASVGGQA